GGVKSTPPCRICPPCCPRAGSGHAPAPPTRAVNSRRFIRCLIADGGDAGKISGRSAYCITMPWGNAVLTARGTDGESGSIFWSAAPSTTDATCCIAEDGRLVPGADSCSAASYVHGLQDCKTAMTGRVD